MRTESGIPSWSESSGETGLFTGMHCEAVLVPIAATAKSGAAAAAPAAAPCSLAEPRSRMTVDTDAGYWFPVAALPGSPDSPRLPGARSLARARGLMEHPSTAVSSLLAPARQVRHQFPDIRGAQARCVIPTRRGAEAGRRAA